MSGTAAPSSPEGAAGRRQVSFGLVRLVARSWWVFVLRGVAGILFALLAFLFPGLGLALILGFLAAWMAIDGVGSIYQAVQGGPTPGERSRAWLWVDGIIALLAAAVVLFAPGLSALGLVIVTGAWFVVAGVARLILAFRLSSVLLGLLGALSIVIGVWLVLDPGPGLLALIWLVGIQAAAVGALMIGLGWRLRRVHHDPHHLPERTRI